MEREANGEISLLSSRIREKNALTLKDVIAATEKDDVMCIDLIEDIGNNLGKHIAGLINILNPELVIIGGALSLTGDYMDVVSGSLTDERLNLDKKILQPIKTAVRKYSLNLVNRDTTIVISKLGDNAGLIGSCLISRSRMFEE